MEIKPRAYTRSKRFSGLLFREGKLTYGGAYFREEITSAKDILDAGKRSISLGKVVCGKHLKRKNFKSGKPKT